MPSRRPQRDLDIVVFGATGFTGRLVADYLARSAPPGTSIGLAGRSRRKLEAIRADLPPAAAQWPLIIADSADPVGLAVMAQRCRVLLTTVGPYAKYGMPVVAACAAAGTHYVDLTGEILFIRDSIDAFDLLARDNGARIVHSCGFDSVPSDLGVLLLHDAAAQSGGALGETTFGLMSVSGGFSGGTAASMMGQLEEMQHDSARARMATDWYSLSPDRANEPATRQPGDFGGVSYNGDLGAFVAPFLMSSINTRVVRRSNALLGYAYGRDFTYREVMATGGGPLGALIAGGIAVGLGAGVAGLRFGPTRAAARRFLPKPGEGPDVKTRTNGHFLVRLVAHTAAGSTWRGMVAAQGDPGYAATAMMLSESALTLAVSDGLPDRTGVLTPATALGLPLADRLRAAGMTWSAHES